MRASNKVPRFSKRHYQVVAEALRKAQAHIRVAPVKDKETELLGFNCAVSHLSLALETDNPKFRRQHFLAVVRGEKSVKSRPAKGGITVPDRSAELHLLRKQERAKAAEIGEQFEREADQPYCREHFSPLPCPICSVEDAGSSPADHESNPANYGDEGDGGDESNTPSEQVSITVGDTSYDETSLEGALYLVIQNYNADTILAALSKALSQQAKTHKTDKAMRAAILADAKAVMELSDRISDGEPKQAKTRT